LQSCEARLVFQVAILLHHLWQWFLAIALM
jgi:hypothetical protein